MPNFFYFYHQNICCGYSKEPSQWDGSFEHLKHMLKLMGKKIFTILRSKFVFIWASAWALVLYHFQLSRWPQQFLKNLSYHIHNISFPDDVVSLDNDKRGWRDMFRPCATQRLFFPVSIRYIYPFIFSANFKPSYMYHENLCTLHHC